MLDLFMKQSHNPNFTNNSSCLERLIKNENSDLNQIKHLVNSKANPKLSSPLLFFQCYKSYQVVEYLLSFQDNLNQKDVYCKNFLHIAVQTPNVQLETIELLMDRKVNVNELDSLQQTPLHIAYKKNLTHIIDLFHSKFKKEDLKLSFIDVFQNSILHSVCGIDYSGFSNILKLLENNADPNIKDKNDKTPFHCAASNNSLEVLEFLIEKKFFFLFFFLFIFIFCFFIFYFYFYFYFF